MSERGDSTRALEAEEERPVRCTTMPKWVPGAAAGWLVLIVSTAVAFHSAIHLSVLALSVPAYVFWLGALGGLAASAQGIFVFNSKWDASYNLWHIGAPAVGAAYGLVGYLFLSVFAKSGSAAGAVYALGAFTLGYTQSQFSALIHRTFNVLFQTGKAGGSTDEH